MSRIKIRASHCALVAFHEVCSRDEARHEEFTLAASA